jgi:DNA-binding transcriptional MerR regulator
MQETFTFSEMCRLLGRSPTVVRGIQQELGLTSHRRRDGRFSEFHLRLLEKVIALRAFGVPLADISDLLDKERKILSLLHFDAIEPSSPEWFLEGVDLNAPSSHCLVLTGYNIGFAVTSEDIQVNLDFRERDRELFNGAEMGEDIRRVLHIYVERLAKVASRVDTEKPVLRNALAWSEVAFMLLEPTRSAVREVSR